MNKKKQTQAGSALTITENKKETLTKEQIAFNKLIDKIELLNKKIENEKLKNEKLLEVYSRTIPPLNHEIAKAYYSCATALAEAIQGKKFSVKRKDQIRETILWFCGESFDLLPPDESMIEFYDAWSELSYKEELEEESRMEMEEISEALKYNFGLDIDLSDLDNSPEGFARLQERIKGLKEEDLHKSSTSFNKNKKQRSAELKKAQEESEKLKSLRKIYIDLAKMLHPDLTSDHEDKLVREEMMKQVTTAYNEKDISTLLKLELKWVTKEKDIITSLPIDKLNLYIENLKDQTRELEMKLYAVSDDPRYYDIKDLTFISEKAALKEIKETSELLKNKFKDTEGIIELLNSGPTKEKIIELLDDLQSLSEDDILFDLDFLRTIK